MNISFYQKPKIPCSSYEIDFLDDYDKYNPYSKINRYSIVNLKSINNQIFNWLIEDFINIDLLDTHYINVYSNLNFKNIFSNFIYDIIIKNSIEIHEQIYFKVSITEKRVKSILLGSCFFPIVCGILLTIKNKYVMHTEISHFYDCRKRKKQYVKQEF